MIHFLIFAVFLLLVIYVFYLMIPARKMTEGKSKTVASTSILLIISAWLMAISGNSWTVFGLWMFNSAIWYMNYLTWKKKTKKIISEREDRKRFYSYDEDIDSDTEDRVKRFFMKYFNFIWKWLEIEESMSKKSIWLSIKEWLQK